jgi:uncharacterized RDD family membrane protein YckC
MDQVTSNTESEPMEIRIISGFWRRLFAFLIDCLILGVFGMLSGVFLFETYVSLGSCGRLVGFFIALIYFGFFNSRFGNGRTLGKRLMRIEVVDHSGKPIPLSRSILRYCVIGVPFFLNGVKFSPDILSSPLWVYLIAILIVGLGGAIIYLYIFNRQTRQSLHDLTAGTFVVRDAHEGISLNAKIWNGHLVVVGIWFLVVVGLVSFTSNIAKQGSFSELLAVQKSILQTGKAYATEVTVGTGRGVTKDVKWEKTFLRAEVNLKKIPSDYESEAKEIVSTILDQNAIKEDILILKLVYGYNIGLAYLITSHTFEHSLKNWKDKLGRKDSS